MANLILTSKEKVRLGRLRYRRDWLKQRIAGGSAEGKDYAYDKQEASALTWAIDLIERLVDDPDQQ